ncbi:creatininase family protein [Halorubrum saccharovorum]|uniref:creatininase family protein n=1 Tax=Halorubrum saccharovorum TaxID=2248 RepID=UPI001F1E2DAF|nr:creatininase family protein [Halorubrum saccharovorum]
MAALAEVARQFSRDERPRRLRGRVHVVRAVVEHAGDMGHAGPLETALLRATNPALVREDRIGLPARAPRTGGASGSPG